MRAWTQLPGIQLLLYPLKKWCCMGRTEQEDRTHISSSFPHLVPEVWKFLSWSPPTYASLWDVWCRIHKVFGDLPLDTFLWVHTVTSILDFYTIWKVIFDLKVLNLVSVEALQGLFPCGAMPSTAAMLCILSPPAKLALRMPACQQIRFASS